MIAQLSGKLISKTPTTSVIDCQGVGYEISHSPFTAEKLTGDFVSVFVHTHVREDALQLFGFFSSEERQMFRELVKVSGVGPKMAMSILSGIPYEELLTALSQKDIGRLQKIPGIGKKTAERLAIELSDRLAKMPMELELRIQKPQMAKENQLESVLLNLGYQRPEIQRALKAVKSRETSFDSISLEVLVKHTLRELSAPRPN
jgi:Holliday junction DNA helicase RuvA